MPKVCEEARVLHQRSPMAGAYDLTLSAPTIARSARPGQFVEVAVPHGGALLRRPLGIAETSAEAGEIRLIYRVVGRGTELLAAADTGETISVLGPLGHGFNVTYRHPLLVGGGMGLTPLLFFAAAHGSSSVLMGGRTKAELFWEELFRPHVRAVHATTDDGSYGTAGFVTTLLPELLQEGDYDAVAVCGPPIMMESVAQMAASFGLPCEVSLERRMACGLGACLSCAVDTRSGRRKVCKDGPVFSAEEVYGHVS